jgi:dihydrofolate reductase
LEEALEKVEYDPIIIGGAQLYQYALKNDLVSEVIATEIDGTYECDTFFPDMGTFPSIQDRTEYEGFKIVRYHCC